MTLLPEVRAAIVKGVPEIQGHCLRHARTTKSCEFCAAYVRPIRLADVLRAIAPMQEKAPGFGLSVNAYGGIFKTSAPDWEEKYEAEWNLAADTLDDQSEETIAFLHSVLCV